MHRYQHVIVVGGSSGIGEAITRQFLADGSTVFVLARNLKEMQAMKRTLPKKQQDRLTPFKCDIRSNDAVKSVLDTIFKQSSIDLVVANAGVGFQKPLAEYSDEEVNTVLDTNLRGTIQVVRASLAAKNKPLQIVCTSSLAGKMGFPEMSIYSASKFGIEGFIEALRYEYAPTDVSFTILRPGITATPFFKKAGMEAFQESVKDLKNYYTPEKVAELFIKNLTPTKKTIVIGNDKYFLATLPFVPHKYRFRVLDLVNKL